MRKLVVEGDDEKLRMLHKLINSMSDVSSYFPNKDVEVPFEYKAWLPNVVKLERPEEGRRCEECLNPICKFCGKCHKWECEMTSTCSFQDEVLKEVNKCFCRK